MRRRRSPPGSYLSLARSDLYRSRTFGSGASLATSLRFEKAIGCLRGFLWKQEVGWPKSHSCLLLASLGKSPGAVLSPATEAVSAGGDLPLDTRFRKQC